MDAPKALSGRGIVVEKYRRFLGRGRARLAEYIGADVEVRSEGSVVYTADGTALIDCGGYSVFLLGHCHPVIVEAVVAQVRTHPLATRLLLEAQVATAAELLLSIAPDGLNKAFFVNSGTEATELALKLARAQHKTKLICMRKGYHGKTLGALSVTQNPVYQRRFGPLFEATAVDFGDLADLERALMISGGNGAVILEPVQGEGGVVIPPLGYLSGVGKLCRQFGAMLIVDEIQTGLGRCGRMWAHAPEISLPDVLLVGKALSGGVVPVAAVLATDVAFAPIGDDPTLHSSTFGGSPLASAAVAATVQTIVDEHIVDRAADLGARLLAYIERVCEPYKPRLVTDVRGVGLLIGIEFARPDLTAEVASEMLCNGVIVNHSLNDHAVLRITPPAILGAEQEEKLLDALTTSLSTLSTRFATINPT